MFGFNCSCACAPKRAPSCSRALASNVSVCVNAARGNCCSSCNGSNEGRPVAFAVACTVLIGLFGNNVRTIGEAGGNGFAKGEL